MSRTGRRRGSRRGPWLLAAAATFVVLTAAPAQAHATTVDTAPANGQQVDARPGAVVVTFDEPVTLLDGAASAVVLDTGGDRVDARDPRLDAGHTVLTIPLDAALPRGSYIASWSVVSADSHPVGGSLQFGYGQPASVVQAVAPPGPSPALTLATGLVKGALYLALVVAFALLPAAALLGADSGERHRVRRAAAYGAAAAAAVSVVQVVVQYLWVSSPSTGAVTFADVARSTYGVAAGVRVLALVAASLLLRGVADADDTRSATAAGRVAVALAALGLLAVGTIAVAGHGGAGPWWRLATTALHGAAAIAWLGGLAVLAWALLRRRLGPDRLARMGWWSLYAGTSVAVLAATGLVQAAAGVRFWGALTTTTYGVVLLAKLALVLVALALAASGLRWTRRQRRHGRPAPGQTARLRARVRWEAGTAAVVVVVSGVLSSTTPAEAAYRPTVTQHAQIGPYTVTFEAGPARRGPESFRVTAVPPTADAPLPQDVALLLRQDGGPVRGLRATFPYRVAGTLQPGRPTPMTFTSASLTVPSTGRWTATVTVVAGELEQYTADFHFEVH